MVFNGRDLLSQVGAATDKAIANGTVKWTESEIIHLPATSAGYAFEVTYAPQLGQKPTQPKAKDAPKPQNPFLPPYSPDSYVTEARDEEEGEDFVVLLNKFMVAKRHCLLCTKDFEPQTQPPTPAMMSAAYECLRSWEAQGSHWQGIYNCGSESGASQPHRHLQLIPLNGDATPLSRLVRAARSQAQEGILSLSSLPYAHFIAPLSSDSNLGDALFRLLNARHEYFLHSEESGKSYNLILSPSYLMLVPRSLSDAELGDGIAPLGVNALAYSGCVLVKNEQQLDRVRQLGGEGLLDLLKVCGYPPRAQAPHQDADVDE